MNDLRVLRERLIAASDAFDAAQAGGDAFGSAAMLAQTMTVATYPTTASTFYAVVPCDADGNEQEGAAATYTQRAGAIDYALNLGTAIPPSGTTIVCHAAGGRWVFRFDG